MRKYTGLLALFALFLTSGAYGAGGDITFTPKGSGPVVFSHDLHTKSRGMKCLACHFDRFAVGGGGFKISQEKLNKREFCGHCHNGMKSFDMESKKNCVRCHKKR